MKKPLEGRVAVVTGASRGLGAEIALHLAADGANVVVNYLNNADKAEQIASAINSSRGHMAAIAVRADVSSSGDVARLFDKAEEIFGVVHIVVNNAGIIDSTCATIAETSPEAWDATFSANCRAPFLTCKDAARRLLPHGGGRIINISGTLVATPRPGFGAYTASKAAMETMTQILARELEGTGVTANCVAPGPIATDMFFAVRDEESVKRIAMAPPLERLGDCKDIARVVAFLARPESESINGQILRVNGGLA